MSQLIEHSHEKMLAKFKIPLEITSSTGNENAPTIKSMQYCSGRIGFEISQFAPL